MLSLQAAGLSQTEANAYEALLAKPAWQPSELAKNVGESRTNMYKVLDKLVSLELAEKFDHHKKLHYRATNPTRLLELSREIREKQKTAEQDLAGHTQTLISNYVKTQEQPGVRYYQGESQIGQIFEQIASSKSEVLFVHTLAGADYYGFEAMHKLRMKAVKAGVQRRALTPDGSSAPSDYRITDPLVLLKRTWLAEKDYTAPVEWGTFDNKLYLISYGSEAFGLTIESKQIASAFKQLFTLLETTQKQRSEYKKLPQQARGRGVTK
jgi:sugar-specific transcriptional regulator TrmB